MWGHVLMGDKRVEDCGHDEAYNFISIVIKDSQRLELARYDLVALSTSLETCLKSFGSLDYA